MSDYKPEDAEEKDFLKNYDPSNYSITTVTVDVVIRRGSWEEAQVVLIKRKNFPYRGYWALPGGFMDADETSAAAAMREVMEEAGMELGYLDFVTILDNPERDPRGRCVSIVYEAGVYEYDEPFPGDDAIEAKWFPLYEAQKMQLAFDHNTVLDRYDS